MDDVSKTTVITRQSETYPGLLRQIAEPPQKLYCMGTLPTSDEICLAIVGTRKSSSYGRLVAGQIAGDLAAAGIIIISGLALGIDAIAHEAALAQGRPTIAVLAGGTDWPSIYPRQHEWLARRIIAGGGAIISEQPPGTPALRWNFLARNRIISGLCQGTLIIDCPVKSGALVTAHYAMDQNRNVYAVPGPVTSENSKGPHRLIQQGAMLVTSAADILADLNLAIPAKQQVRQPLTKAEEQVLQYIDNVPKAADQITTQCGLSPAAAGSCLTTLELKGYIEETADGYIKLT